MGVRKVARRAGEFLPLISLLLAAISDFRGPSSSVKKEDITKP